MDCLAVQVGLPQPLKITDSPTHVTVKLTGLTDGYVPYHVSDAAGLADSPIFTDGSKVGIGVKTPLTYLFHLISGDEAPFCQERFSNSPTQGPGLVMRRARGVLEAYTVLNEGDHLGAINWLGWSGTAGAFISGARIRAYIDGTPDSAGDTTDMPGRLEFLTTPDGSNTGLIRVVIKNDGSIGLGTQLPVCRAEFEDSDTTGSMVVKITQDDATVYGLVIGNDTYSTTDTNGLRFQVDNTGHAYIQAMGTVNTNSLYVDVEASVIFRDYAAGVPVTALTISPNSATVLTIGGGAAGVDYILKFDGETNDGTITWMEDENYFQFNDEVLMSGQSKLYFQSTSNYIYGYDISDLHIVCPGEMKLFSNSIRIGRAADTDITFTFDGNSHDGVLTWMEDEDYFSFGDNVLLDAGSLYITELAAAQADIAAKGQFWVKNDTPNVPMFTDDAGTDHQLAYA